MARKPIETPNGPFEATWESLLDHRPPQWYVDGKFGIFVHWGPYCVPAFGNEWYPRQMYLQGTPEFEHHLKTYGPHKEFGYKDFIPRFRAQRFSAEAWAELFAKSGARFVVPVAEHHDGFAMYDSSFSQWCATRMGPKRDVLGELAEAVRARGMVFGASTHRAEHWWFMNGGMAFDSDVQDPRYADFYGPAKPDSVQPNQVFLEDWLARTCEIVDKYARSSSGSTGGSSSLYSSPICAASPRYSTTAAGSGTWGWRSTTRTTPTRRAPPCGTSSAEACHPCTFFWQTDTAVARNSWGYVDGMDYKTPTHIIGDLVDIVSKNGALLLNVGPRADGTIPQEDQRILRSIGSWLRVNGEAIYGTRPWRVRRRPDPGARGPLHGHQARGLHGPGRPLHQPRAQSALRHPARLARGDCHSTLPWGGPAPL